MSHFTMLVLSKPDQSLDELFAPYDENIEVEPYRCYEEGKPEDHWLIRHLQREGKELPTPITWQQVADESLIYATGDDGEIDDEDRERVYVDDGLAYTLSTYNPRSKWDWWQVGGRYRNRLLTKGGLFVDSAQKRELSISELRETKRNEALAKRAAIVRAINDEDAVASYRTWEQMHDSLDNVDIRRDRFWAQTATVKYKASLDPKSEEASWFNFDGGTMLDRYLGKNEEQVAAQAAAEAWAGWGLLNSEGHWYERGKMGWFGMSDATGGTTLGYLEVANAIIDSADDDMIFTMTDCHI
jgi:hypothetical protein